MTTLPSDLLIAFPLALAGLLLAFLVAVHRFYEKRLAEQRGLVADLMDRLMTRDAGEYMAVRRERVEPERPQRPEYHQTEEENILGYQMMGDDWQEPQKWLQDYQLEVDKMAGHGR